MSSDSSDEENLDLLKEAQDNNFLNDSMFSQTPEKKTSKIQSKETLPSLRPSRNEDEQFNFLKVTPEFRSFVARKLSSILDEKLKEQLADVEVEEIPRKKRKKGCIKLLSDSKTFLETALEANKSGTAEAINVKKPSYNRLKVDVPEELLKEVAVSPEDILSKKEVKNWSKRSKAPVFKYKKNKNGKLELVESEFK